MLAKVATDVQLHFAAHSEEVVSGRIGNRSREREEESLPAWASVALSCSLVTSSDQAHMFPCTFFCFPLTVPGGRGFLAGHYSLRSRIGSSRYLQGVTIVVPRANGIRTASDG